MRSSPLLSICIATYNRADFICETINSIIPQLDDNVELLIVDGASPDNTEDVVQKYVQKESRIRYVRLSTKGGVDQDYDKAVELAHGKFCWLFTDDDIIKPGAVIAVKAAINKGYDLVVVNAEVRDRELSNILQSRRIMMHDNKEYPPNAMEYFFIDALNYLSFIGAVVIRRSLWLGRERASYFGTEFIHVGVIFQKSLPGSAFIIAEPYITIRFDNAQWESRRFDIWMFKWPKLVWSFDCISDSAKQHVTKSEPWRDYKQLISQRSRGQYNIQLYNQYLSNMKASIFWKFCAYLISSFPKKVLVGMLSLYSLIKNLHYREQRDI